MDHRRRGTLGVTDPATEDTLVEIADGTPEDALAAVGRRARGAARLGRDAAAAARRSACAGPGR